MNMSEMPNNQIRLLLIPPENKVHMDRDPPPRLRCRAAAQYDIDRPLNSACQAAAILSVTALEP